MENSDFAATIGIVEDEPIESEAMARYIEQNFPYAKVVWRMTDGAAALEALKKEAPDVLIVDIEMPVMNGLELCERLCRQQYKGVILINTAYAEFTYAKKMISLKAFDYIVKPVRNEELSDALGRCIEEAERRAEGRRHQQDAEDTIQSARQYAASLLTKPFHEDAGEQLFFEALGWPAADALQAYVIHITSKTAYSAEHLSSLEEMKRSFVGHNVSLGYEGERHLIVIAQPGERQPPGRWALLIWCFAACCLQIAPNACAAVSSLCEDRTAVTREYRWSRPMPEALPDTVPARIAMPGRAWRAIRRSDAERCRSRFKRYLNSGQFERAKKAIAEIAGQYSENSDDAIWETAQLVLDAALCVWPDAPLKQSLAGLLRHDPEPVRWLHGFLEVCAVLPQYENWDLADSALRIMRASFSQDITQTAVAEELGLNPAYFSRMFKKRTGRNFSDVLTDIRMQHAEKMLLQNPGCSLDELCKGCGLSSKTYFCEVFKKWKGMTITQFLMSRTK